jgi:hypothetical protein
VVPRSKPTSASPLTTSTERFFFSLIAKAFPASGNWGVPADQAFFWAKSELELFNLSRHVDMEVNPKNYRLNFPLYQPAS